MTITMMVARINTNSNFGNGDRDGGDGGRYEEQ